MNIESTQHTQCFRINSADTR